MTDANQRALCLRARRRFQLSCSGSGSKRQNNMARVRSSVAAISTTALMSWWGLAAEEVEEEEKDRFFEVLEGEDVKEQIWQVKNFTSSRCFRRRT